MSIVASSFAELQRDLMLELSYEGLVCAPRGQKVREVLALTFELTDPRARLSTSPARAANYGFAAGEFLWYLRGARDLESIAYYNARMPAFSDDGVTLHSAYGYRTRFERGPFVRSAPPTQWENVVAELRKDPDSRRAVMTIYRPGDLARALSPDGTKDVPCTLALQFFIRERRLHLHVTMRSNDVVWGLCNDLFSFTLLQEAMLLDLREAGAPVDDLGSYHHTAGSMHVYERHWGMRDQIIAEDVLVGRMPPIGRRADLDALLEHERVIRENRVKRIPLPGYDGGALWLLDRLVEHRARRDAEGA